MKKIIVVVLCLATGAALAQDRNATKSFELASLIKQLMVNSAASGTNKDSYLELKKLFGSLREANANDLQPIGNETFPGNGAEFFRIYQTRADIQIKGVPLAEDNLKNDSSWRIWVAGPKAMATNVYIRSENAVNANTNAGASYFAANGLTLDPIVCHSIEGSARNYSAYYKVTALGKRPVLLGISASTGSGGTWYSYEVTWFALKASRIDQAAEVGLCNVKD